VRALRPAVPIDVDVERDRVMRIGPKPRGGAAAIPPPRSSAGETPPEPKEKRIEGEVRVASGPWRVEEKWWSEEAIAREYWDVELSDGGLYRIFRDARSGGWFADGIYD
jgi:hypothetical protein